MSARRDLRLLVEVAVVVVVTWLLVGWSFGEALWRGDGPRLFAPYLRSALEAGTWSEHLYRFGVVGGSAMHGVFGTSPLVELSAALGLAPTTAANLSAFAFQSCVGYLAIVLIEGVITCWSGVARELSRSERVVCVWCCAFVPVFGWRFAAGHENLLVGLLPWLATISLWWSAHARRISLTSLVVGWFAVFHALPSLGQQTLTYSLVFGAPVLIATLAGVPRGKRFGAMHVAVALALAAGVLCAAPRVWEMVSYYGGDDASRSAQQSMFHAYGDPMLRDWLGSLPWTSRVSAHWPGMLPPHETNYPLGPLMLLAVLLWPRGVDRGLGLATLLGGVLAAAFALDLEPISSLLRALPLVDAFRVPARAMIPIAVFVPIVALAVVFSRLPPPTGGRRELVTLVCAPLALLALQLLPSVARECVAIIGCAVLVVTVRTEHQLLQPWRGALLVVIAALGATEFDDRVRDWIPSGRIEDAPRALRTELVAVLPNLQMPLNRVQLVDRPMPFSKGTAFAAGLPSLDGVWFPPRRFRDLLGALRNHPLSPAEADFEVTPATPGFDVLTQLYNIKYVANPDGAILRTPSTNGPAWFVREIVAVVDSRHMVLSLSGDPGSLRDQLARRAWVKATEMPSVAASDDCVDARVSNVSSNRFGSEVYVDATTPAACVLIVATSYTSQLRASTTRGALRVFPANVALTGVVVPLGTHRITIHAVPAGSGSLAVIFVSGLLSLGGALILVVRLRRE